MRERKIMELRSKDPISRTPPSRQSAFPLPSTSADIAILGDDLSHRKWRESPPPLRQQLYL
jgi:hypothetical protein